MGEGAHTSWDDIKNEINIARRGIDFSALDEVFDGRFALTTRDGRRDYGEQRFNMLVVLKGMILNVTFTPRSGKQRIVSARLASRKERRLYDAYRQDAQARDRSD